MKYSPHPSELALGLAVTLRRFVDIGEATRQGAVRPEPHLVGRLLESAVLAIGVDGARSVRLTPWLSRGVAEFWRRLVEEDGWWHAVCSSLDSAALELLEELIKHLEEVPSDQSSLPLALSARSRHAGHQVSDGNAVTRTFLPVVYGSEGLTLPMTISVVDRSSSRPELSLGVEPSGSTSLDRVTAEFRWDPQGTGFPEGVAAGVHAATRLNATVIGRNEHLCVEAHLVGLLPPTQVEDRSAGLPIALRILAELYPLPPRAIVATGPISDDGALLESDDHTIETKLDAVKHFHPDSRLLVVPTPDSKYSSHPDILVPPGRTLEDAAQLLWGADWDAVVGGIRRSTLQDLDMQEGWVGGYADGVKPWGTLLSVDLPAETALYHRLSKSSGKTGLILSGPPLSGRTWIAETVASRLAFDGWRVHALTYSGVDLPEASHVLQALKVTGAVPGTERTVVFIDGLQVVHDREAEVLVHELADTTGFAIVLIIEAIGNAAERFSDSEEVYVAVTGKRPLLAFAEAFCRTDARLGTVRPLVPAIVGAHGRGDIAGLVRHLVAAAQDSEATVEGSDPRRLELASLSRDQRQSLGELAVLSMNGMAMAFDGIPSIPPETLRRLGASEGHRGWYLGSPVIRQAAVDAARRIERLAARDFAAKVLARVLQPRLISGDPRMATTMNRLANVERPGGATFDRVVSLQKHRLEEWLGVQVDLEAVSLMLHALGTSTRIDAKVWAERLHDLLVRSMSNADARSIGHAIRHLHRLERSTGSPHMDDIVNRLLDGDLARTFSRARGPAQRMPLVRALVDLERDDVEEALGELDALICRTQTPFKVRDLYALIDFDDAMRNTALGWTSEGDFAALATVRAVLATEFPARDIPIRFAQLAIARRAMPRDNHIRWDELLEDVSEVLRMPGANTRLTELREGLERLVQADRRLVSAALGRARYRGAFRTGAPFIRLAYQAMPGELAAFLDSVRRVHAGAARDMLFDGTRVRADLARVIADRIRECTDGRGAGLVLRAAADIDDLFAGAERFSDTLGAALGPAFVLERIRYEPRASVLAHLVRGLARANVQFSETVVERVVEAIGELIEVSDRPWAPELALALGKDEVFEDRFQFFDRVADRLAHTSHILEWMRSASDASVGLFHELGRCIDDVAETDGICAQFANRFLPTIEKSRVGEADVPTLGPATLAVWKTLRRAGTATEHRDRLFDVVDRRFDQSVGSAGAGATASTISALQKVDSARTTALVSRNEDRLVELVLHSSPRGVRDTVELVAALHRVDARISARAMEAVVENGTIEPMLRRLVDEQHPALLGRAIRQIEKARPGTTAGVADGVFYRWRAQIKELTSPSVIAAVLQTVVVFDLDQARELSALVDTAAITRRLAAGARADIAGAKELAAAHVGLGHHEAARSIVVAVAGLRHLRAVAPDAVPLFPLARILGVRLGAPESFAGAVSAGFSKRRLADHADHLVRLGILAACLPSPPGVDTRPRVLDLPLEPEVAVWSVLNLRQEGWVADELNRRLDELMAQPLVDLSPWAAATRLLAAVATGRTIEAGSATQYVQAVRVNAHILGRLLAAVDQIPSLASLRHRLAAEVIRRQQDPYRRLGAGVVTLPAVSLS